MSALSGAGIAGMTTAYLLGREGKSVVVLDDGPIGGGMTGRTTAHLVNALDDRYFELERSMVKRTQGWRRRVIPRPSTLLKQSLSRRALNANSNDSMDICLCLHVSRRKFLTMN